MPMQYPLSAVVASDDLVLALLLASVSPEIGGVLVRGEKGTAKTTTVRGLAEVLPPIDVVAGDRFSSDPRDAHPMSPDGPFGPDPVATSRPVRLVELPIGATEDRVLGSLHLQRALADGVAEFEPGLLALAHRGILYVDEVNLLHDHLVDVLLDAAATGRVSVERDGVSITHSSRFVLIGTMNPEEGELRPQLLDRFGLTVDVSAPRDADQRVEVVRRRLAFDADPDAFVARYAELQAALRARIASAQALLPDVDIDDDALRRIAEVCAAFDVDGMRADIVTARTAAAHAAWDGRTRVTTDDIRVAARLALPHRRRRNPFDAPGIDEGRLEDLLDDPTDDDVPPDDPPPDGGDPYNAADTNGDSDESGADGPAAPGPADPDPAEDRSATRPLSTSGPADPDPAEDRSATRPLSTSGPATVAPGATYRPRALAVPGVGTGQSGRRSRAITDHGRRVGAEVPTDGRGRLHLVETIRAAASRNARDEPTADATSDSRLRLAPADLRVAVTEGRESNLVLFCVDASGSMAASRRMREAKAAVLSLLTDAYQRRDKVGLVTFRGDRADLALPPTSSVDAAASRLTGLPAGGRTPLAEALALVGEVVRVERIRDPRRRPLVVLVTDGRATHGPQPVARARRAGQALASARIPVVVVDCETGRFRLGLARELAGVIGAEHLPVSEVDAASLVAVASRRTLAPGRGARAMDGAA